MCRSNTLSPFRLEHLLSETTSFIPVLSECILYITTLSVKWTYTMNSAGITLYMTHSNVCSHPCIEMLDITYMHV